MADQKPGSDATSQSFSIGGNAVGVAQVAGKGNTVAATGTMSAGPDPAVLAALEAIRASLAGNVATRTLADAAVHAAKAEQPDKQSVGEHLQAAIEVAKTTAGWVETAKGLAPHLATLGTWLGGQWSALAALIR